MLVRDQPLAVELLETNGEAKIQGPGGRAVAVHVARYECDVVTGRCSHAARRESELSTLILEKEIPGGIVGLQPSDLIWKIVHQQVGSMVAQDGTAITAADGIGPVLDDALD